MPELNKCAVVPMKRQNKMRKPTKNGGAGFQYKNQDNTEYESLSYLLLFNATQEKSRMHCSPVQKKKYMAMCSVAR